MRIVPGTAALFVLVAVFSCAYRGMFTVTGTATPSTAPAQRAPGASNPQPFGSHFKNRSDAQALQRLKSGGEQEEGGFWWAVMGAVFLAVAAAVRSRDTAEPRLLEPRVATLSLSARETGANVTQRLGGVQLAPLGPTGRIAGDAVPLSSLWAGQGAVVFVVRRPG